MGDEGSGTFFGRKLLTAFLYGTMPEELSASFKEKFSVDKESVIKRIYQQPAPNSFLASFAPFMSDHIEHPFIIELLKIGFEEFVETNIKSYPDYQKQICHFVGSIAFHFREILTEICETKGIRVGKILKHPIEELSDFILNNGVKSL